MGPEEEEKEAEEIESDDEKVVDEFETVEEEEPEVVEEFETFDENAPDEIKTSGFKTKVGEIPGYEPTVDEVLSYAMGKTHDPAELPPVPEPDPSVGESSILPNAQEPEEPEQEAEVEEEAEEEAEEEPEVDADLAELLDEVEEAFGGDERSAEEEPKDELAEVFDEDEEKE